MVPGLVALMDGEFYVALAVSVIWSLSRPLEARP
jgi:hypothetical protein